MAIRSSLTANRALFTCVLMTVSTRPLRDKIAMLTQAQERYASIRDKPATIRWWQPYRLHMNAGLDGGPSLAGHPGPKALGCFAPSCNSCPQHMPSRPSWRPLYTRMDAAAGKASGVPHARYRVGQSAALYEAHDEPNPRIGWRAIRVGWTSRASCACSCKRLIRAANGGPLTRDVPLHRAVARISAARAEFDKAMAREEAGPPAARQSVESRRDAGNPIAGLAPRQFLRDGRFHLDRRQ